MDHQNNNAQQETVKNGARNIFATLYHTRLVVKKGEETVLNLSILFAILSLLSAPWLVIFFAIAGLILGYRVSIARNASGFAESLDSVVKNAGDNVRGVVDGLTGSNQQ